MDNFIKHSTEDALTAAVKGNWDEVVLLNKKIIESNPDNLSAYLRLGFGYLQLNEWENAKKAYHKALNIQPASHIAKNNLEKIKILEKKSGKPSSNNQKGTALDPNLFINIFGKTKVIDLINVGQAHTLVRLVVGQQVYAKVKKRRIEIRNEENEYIGTFPDDISKRLMYFMEEKSEYSIFIKEATKQSVSVFVREEKKGKRVEKYTSFPKNIQDDLKMMGTDEDFSDHDGKENEDEQEEDSEHSPFDIESIAEKSDEAELFSDIAIEEDEQEDFEE